MVIEFWEGENNRIPVAEYIERLRNRHKKKILQLLEYLQIRGLALLNSKFLKKFKGYDNLYEARLHFDKTHYRILFTVTGETIILLHVFEKKSYQTPLKEISLAEQRARSITHI